MNSRRKHPAITLLYTLFIKSLCWHRVENPANPAVYALGLGEGEWENVSSSDKGQKTYGCAVQNGIKACIFSMSSFLLSRTCCVEQVSPSMMGGVNQTFHTAVWPWPDWTWGRAFIYFYLQMSLSPVSFSRLKDTFSRALFTPAYQSFFFCKTISILLSKHHFQF